MVVHNGGASGTFNLQAGRVNFGDTAAGSQSTAGLAPSTLLVNSAGTFSFTGGTLENVTTIDVADGGTPGNVFTQDGGRFVIGVDGGLTPNAASRATTSILGEYATATAAAPSVLAVDIFGNQPGDFHQANRLGQEQLILEPSLTALDVINSPTASDLLVVGADASAFDVDDLEIADLTAGFTLDVDLNGLQAPFLGYYDVLLADEILIDPETFSLDGIRLWRVRELQGGGQVLQVAAPEPASLALWCLAAAALAFGFRRRNRAGR